MTTRTIRDATEKLKNLQSVDLEIRKLRKEGERWPAIMASRDREIDEKKARVKACEDAHQALKLEIRKREGSLKTLEEAVVKLNVQLNTVKNNKEYKAILNEIALKKSDVSTIEEEILRFMERIDEASKETAAAKAVLQASLDEKEKIAKQAKSEIAEIQSEIAALETRRKTAREPVPADLLERYEKIAKSRDGAGLAAVLDGACQGCFLNLTAQEINLLMAGDEVVTCRSCSRILFLER